MKYALAVKEPNGTVFHSIPFGEENLERVSSDISTVISAGTTLCFNTSTKKVWIHSDLLRKCIVWIEKSNE